MESLEPLAFPSSPVGPRKRSGVTLGWLLEREDQLWQRGCMQKRARVSWLAAALVLSCCSRAEPSAKPKACTPARDYWPKPHNFRGLRPILFDLALDRNDKLYLGGELVTPAQLRRTLRASHQLNPEPEIFLHTEMGASCSALETVRDEMDRALECRKPYSSCSEGVFVVWKHLPTPPGTPPS